MWKRIENETDEARIAKAEREKKLKKLIVEEKMEIIRIIEEKKKEKEDLIKIRMVEEIVPRKFHKYLKAFEKKESKRMLTRKTWNYTINLRECFVPKKREIYLL